MIFVSGIHGVGKTFFCKQMKEQLGINAYSASELIAKKRNRGFSTDKIVSGIDENQLLLLDAVNELHAIGDEFILDGHFCLLNADGIISRIPIDTYISLSPDMIILLTENPEIIAARRFQRDGIVVNKVDIDSFQKEEIAYADEVARKLGIQLDVSSGSSDLENIIQKIREGGH
jgi:adenylate kinase